MQLDLQFAEPKLERVFLSERVQAGAALVLGTEAVRFVSWCTVAVRLLLQGTERQAAAAAVLGAVSSSVVPLAAAFAALKQW